MYSRTFASPITRFLTLLITTVLLLSFSAIGLAQDDSAEESTYTGDPVMISFQLAREAIEEDRGAALYIMRWLYYEDNWSSTDSWRLYGNFGIDSCTDRVPDGQKRSDILFGWTISILDVSGHEYQARVSYDLQEVVVCDEALVPPQYAPPPAPVAPAVSADESAREGETAPDTAQAVASTANVGGFALGGQALSFAHPGKMHDAGMTWVKRQVKWHGNEPAANFQHLINSAKGQGFRVLLSVIGEKGHLGGDYNQRYANFVAGLAQGGADAIEVWNEMNIDREWPSGQISGASYTQMLQAAYNAIKSANSGTLVISGAPAPTGFFSGCGPGGADDNCYLREMAAAGAANYMDCVGIHYNAGITPPQATSGAPVGSSGHYSWYLPSMMNVYRGAFPSKPLCFTELGYLTGEGYGPLPGGFAWASGTTLAQHVQWLADAVRIARNSGYVRLFIVWNVDSTHYGADPQAGYAIVRPGGGCPACDSLKQALS